MNQKYLLISEIFPPRTGGSGRWFWDLYTRIDTDKVVVLSDELRGETDYFEPENLTIYRFDLRSESWGILNWKGIRFYFSLVRKVLKIVKQEKIDVIHCGRTLFEGFVALMVKMLTGTPYVCFVHGEDVEVYRTSREFKLLVNQVIKHAQLLICNSENSKRLLLKWPPARSKDIAILNPGVDAIKFGPANDESDSLMKSKKVLLTVSRLQPRKGQDTLIKAMPKILQDIPNAHYVIVGSGEQEGYLNELIIELNMNEHVSLLGELSDEDILKWYQRADLFVLPNRTVGNDVEGFGIVLLEAQACETPVIAGDSGGTRETMEPGVTGFVVDCRGHEILAERVSELMANDKALESMGLAARQHVLNNYDWPRIIQKARDTFDTAQRA